MQTVMAEKVFYGVPEHLGYFHDHDSCVPGKPCLHVKEKNPEVKLARLRDDDYHRSRGNSMV